MKQTITKGMYKGVAYSYVAIRGKPNYELFLTTPPVHMIQQT